MARQGLVASIELLLDLFVMLIALASSVAVLDICLL
jgi:hypothetical protein